MASGQTIEQLVRMMQAGDETAFNDLYGRTSSHAYYLALQLVKDEEMAQDILQDAYIRALTNIGSLQDPSKFQSWLNSIVVNTGKNYLKKKTPVLFSQMSGEDDQDEPIDFEDENEQFSPEANVDYSETKRLVKEMIDRLPERQRIPILLYYMEDYSVGQIAQTMECSEGTIKSRLSAGRKQIKQEVLALEKQGVKLYCAPLVPFLFWMFHTPATAAVISAAEAATLSAGVSTGTTVGATVASGSAAGASAVTGSAVGTSTAAGSTVGSTVGTGSAMGASAAAGTAVGASTAAGSTVGSTVGTGSAVGAATATGTTVGATMSTGSSVGATTMAGTMVGATVVTGSAVTGTASASAGTVAAAAGLSVAAKIGIAAAVVVICIGSGAVAGVTIVNHSNNTTTYETAVETVSVGEYESFEYIEEPVIEEIIEEPFENLLSFPGSEPMEMTFTSGAGGWWTDLTLFPDGSFTGDEVYSDWVGDKKVPIHNPFEGTFVNIQKIDDYSYSMNLGDIQFEGNGIPYGLNSGVNFIFCHPGAVLPEEAVMWTFASAQYEEYGIIYKYVLLNVEMNYCFEMSPEIDPDEVLASYISNGDILCDVNTLSEGQQDMLGLMDALMVAYIYSSDIYGYSPYNTEFMWNAMLNAICEYVNSQLTDYDDGSGRVTVDYDDSSGYNRSFMVIENSLINEFAGAMFVGFSGNMPEYTGYSLRNSMEFPDTDHVKIVMSESGEDRIYAQPVYWIEHPDGTCTVILYDIFHHQDKDESYSYEGPFRVELSINTDADSIFAYQVTDVKLIEDDLLEQIIDSQ